MKSLVLEPSYQPFSLKAKQTLVGYDLKTVCQQLSNSPLDVEGAERRSQYQYRFPSPPNIAPLLIDEAIKFPISLKSALQTAALYQGMDWGKQLTRCIISGNFFHQYVKLLLTELIPLAFNARLVPDITVNNLIIKVSQGMPISIQLQNLNGTSVQPLHPRFKVAPTQYIFYRRLVFSLLEYNLKVLVAELLEISNEKPEVLWDYAIETILDVINTLPDTENIKRKAQQFLLINELDPQDRIISLTPNCDSTPLANSGIIYLKRKCCKNFKKGNRCFNCPGSKNNR